MEQPQEKRQTISRPAGQRLAELQEGTDTATAKAFFDALPPADAADLTGSWRGSELPTGHRLDGALSALGWHGKRFDGAETCFPLIFAAPDGGTFAVNPALVPLGAVLRLRRPAALRFLRRLMPLLRTRRPGARLRMTEPPAATGPTAEAEAQAEPAAALAPTATMIYDALPINDLFKRIDTDTLLGLMDARGMRRPFFFVLRREPTP